MRFAVRRPGTPEASPRSHGVPRRDVPGRVHVSVAGETAGRAHEPRLALTRPRIHQPACRAPLARKRGINLLHPARRLLRQPPHQQAPPRPQDPPVQPGLSPDITARVLPGTLRGPGHVGDPQVLDLDQVEPPRDVRRFLLRPVLAPVRLAGTQSGDGQPYLPAAGRAPLGAGELAFQPAQPGLLAPGQARNLQPLPSGQGRADGHAPIDAHDPTVTGGGNRQGDGGEGEVPAAGPVEGYPVGLHSRRDGTGPAKPDPPGFRYPYAADLARQAAYLPLAAAPHDPEPLISSGLAPGRPAGRVCAVEERRHSLGEISQRLLLDRLGAGPQPVMPSAGGGELPALLQVTRCARAARPPVSVLLDGQVPHVPGTGTVIPQHRFLGERRDQPVPGHANILSTRSDIPREVTRRSLPGLKAGVSTPRI